MGLLLFLSRVIWSIDWCIDVLVGYYYVIACAARSFFSFFGIKHHATRGPRYRKCLVFIHLVSFFRIV